MANSGTNESVVHRRRGPTILLDLLPEFAGWPEIIARARELEWRLLDLRHRGNDLPTGLVKGAIVDKLPSDKLVQWLLRHKCSTIRIGRLPHPQDGRVPAVVEDLAATGRMGADHFAERGFRHVGYVGHVPWGDFKPLHDAFAARAGEHGMSCHLLRFVPSSELPPEARYRFRRQLFAEWLEGIPRPVGLLGYTDNMAAMLCSMCADVGIRVPEEVAVLGRGNNRFSCECSQLTLSSIALDHTREARTAVDMLLRLMAGKPVPETCVQIAPLNVVIRESTDVLATPDRAVASALRYMWDHLAQDLSAEDISRQVGMSHRQLTRRFRQALGRGINAEMRRKRLEEVCRLLRSTRLTVADIASATGFHSSDYLHRTFRRAFGTTPHGYRRRSRTGG